MISKVKARRIAYGQVIQAIDTDKFDFDAHWEASDMKIIEEQLNRILAELKKKSQ